MDILQETAYFAYIGENDKSQNKFPNIIYVTVKILRAESCWLYRWLWVNLFVSYYAACTKTKSKMT